METRTAASQCPRVRRSWLRVAWGCGPVEVPEDSRDPFAKCRRRRQQADDQIGLPREIEKVTRMREHAVSSEQGEHEVFFRHQAWHLNHGVPPALGSEDLAAGRGARAPHEMLIIARDARLDLPPNGCSTLQQLRR